ncbi:MAG: LuxR C-terminal-related transcriptional regulator, partial [Propionicimonas sp.]|nr:LuxR C-terminal-related transcriptional regulator [Propionicimonas sp.]
LLLRHGAVPRLTRRQLQVLHARARGEAWRVLADRLGISAKTAYDRLEAVMAKLAWHLRFIGLDDHSSPADIEHALGLAPGDLMSLDTYLHSVDRPQPLFSAQAG